MWWRGSRNPRTLSFFTYVFFSCPFGMRKYLPPSFINGFCQLYVTTPNFIHPPICPVGPSIQTYNLSFRVCVMCLRTTTESRGGNRLALCCNPTLTWYDPAPSLLCIQGGWRTANCTPPSLNPSHAHVQSLINHLLGWEKVGLSTTNKSNSKGLLCSFGHVKVYIV